jgi:hypothetical protein
MIRKAMDNNMLAIRGRIIDKAMICILSMCFISGCATDQIIPKPTSLLPEQGQARIILERERRWISDMVRMDIKDNNQIVGGVANGGTLTWDRPQGQMVLSVIPGWDGTFKNSATLTVDVRQGQIYHIKLWTEWDPQGSFLRKLSKGVMVLSKVEGPEVTIADKKLTPGEAIKDNIEREREPISGKTSAIDPVKLKGESFSSINSKEMAKIAVWDLSPGNLPSTYAQDLTSILVSEIAKFKKYEVITQENIRTIAGWTEERMKLGCTDTKCLIALGQMDISKLISGRVGKIGSTYSISLHLFDTQKVKADNSISEECRAEDELIPLVRQTVRKLLAEEFAPRKVD